LGLQRIERCRLTSNRNVMVSFRGGDLRVHEAYLGAPEAVHRAIVVFVQGRTRADRHAARRRITSYTIDTGPPSHRRERTHPDDEPPMPFGEAHCGRLVVGVRPLASMSRPQCASPNGMGGS